MPLGTKYPLAIDTANDLGRWRDLAETTLTAPLGIADVEANVTSTTLLPDAPSMVTIEGEHIAYSGKTATKLTGLTHGQFQSLGGTPSTPHATGAKVTVSPSAVHLHLLRDGIIATQTMLGPQGNNFLRFDDDRIRDVTITVASYDATARQRAKADFGCDGIADQVEINAAIDALPETGGIVRLVGQYFVKSAALLVPPFVTVWGDGERTTRIETTAPDAAIKVADPTVRNEHIRLIGLEFANAGSTPTGLDARGMVRLTGEGLRFYGFSQYGVRLGGDKPAYESSWTGVLRDIFVFQSPTCIRIDGFEGGVTPTGKSWLIDRGEMQPTNTAASVAIDIQDGTDNWVSHLDIGYAAEATAIRLGPNAHRNAIIANRFADIATTTNVSGTSAVVIVPGANGNIIAHSSYAASLRTPHVTGGGVNGNVVMDLGDAWDVEQSATFRRDLMINRPTGYAALRLRRETEAFSRLLIDTNGAVSWFDPTDATGTVRAQLGFRSSADPVVMAWTAGSLVALPRVVSTLPTASAGLRGVVIRVEGATGVADGLYLCQKDAANAYVWVALGAATPRFNALIPFFASDSGVAADREWTNMPAATAEWNALFRRYFDLTNAAQFRLHANVGQAGAAGAVLRVEYSTNESTWLPLGAVAGSGEVPISTAGYMIGAFADIVAGAKAGVFLRLMGNGGNGTADPRFGSISVEVT